MSPNWNFYSPSELRFTHWQSRSERKCESKKCWDLRHFFLVLLFFFFFLSFVSNLMSLTKCSFQRSRCSLLIQSMYYYYGDLTPSRSSWTKLGWGGIWTKTPPPRIVHCGVLLQTGYTSWFFFSTFAYCCLALLTGDTQAEDMSSCAEAAEGGRTVVTFSRFFFIRRFLNVRKGADESHCHRRFECFIGVLTIG